MQRVALSLVALCLTGCASVCPEDTQRHVIAKTVGGLTQYSVPYVSRMPVPVYAEIPVTVSVCRPVE